MEIFQRDSTIFHKNSDDIVVRMSLSKLLENLDESSFIQVSKSTVINTQYLKQLEMAYSGNYYGCVANKNGKVDKEKLLQKQIFTDKKKCQLPKTETEKEILKIWQEVLELEQISTDDTFFSIGGHSIKAITIANLIYKVLGVQISMIDFIECNTIVELAEIVDGSSNEKIEIEKQDRSQYRIN